MPCENEKIMKVVVVGSSRTGKSSLLTLFCNNVLLAAHAPTRMEIFRAPVQLDEKSYELKFVDTSGQLDMEAARALSYPGADAVMVCFAVDEPETLLDVQRFWIPEVRRNCPKAPIVLVGTKSDRREEGRSTCVDEKDVEDMAFTKEVIAYLECSTNWTRLITEVIQVTARAALNRRRRKSQKCVIL